MVSGAIIPVLVGVFELYVILESWASNELLCVNSTIDIVKNEGEVVGGGEGGVRVNVFFIVNVQETYLTFILEDSFFKTKEYDIFF